MDSKTPAQIAVERDERDLYLSDPELYGALVDDDTTIWVAVDPSSDTSSVVVGSFNRDGRFIALEDQASHYTEEMAASPAINWRTSYTLGLGSGFTLPDIDPAAFTLEGSVEVRFDDPRLYEAYVEAPALTLRDAVEALGYDVTEEIDSILTDNPEGPWTLEQLETIFAADVNGDHPHGVEFVVCKRRDEGVSEFIDDGDEDTRL